MSDNIYIYTPFARQRTRKITISNWIVLDECGSQIYDYIIEFNNN